MKFKDLIKLANRQLFNRKWQALLPILSLVVGATTMTFALGAGFGVQSLFEKQLAAERAPRLLEIAPDPSSETESEKDRSEEPVPKYTDPSENKQAQEITATLEDLLLSDTDLKKAAKVSYVEEVSPMHSINMKYVTLEGTEEKYTPGTEPLFDSMELKMLAGEQADSSGKVVVTEAFVELETVGSPQNLVGKGMTLTYINGSGEEEQKEVTISGVRAAGIASTARIFIPYDLTVTIAKAQLQEGESLQPRRAAVRLQPDLNPDQREQVRDDLKATGFRVLDFAQDRDTVQRVGLYLTLAMAAFAGVVIFAALFGVANTMSMSVYERIRQIGLMKALGMSGGTVFLLFAMEGAFIGFWGAVIGIGIAYSISAFLLNPWLAEFFSDKGVDAAFQFVFPPEWILAIIVGLMAIAFLASTLPARRAAKANPIEALRYE